jgi:hypothetical protein
VLVGDVAIPVRNRVGRIAIGCVDSGLAERFVGNHANTGGDLSATGNGERRSKHGERHVPGDRERNDSDGRNTAAVAWAEANGIPARELTASGFCFSGKSTGFAKTGKDPLKQPWIGHQ